MKVITFGSVKGGVGKSAAAIFTAQALAAQGARVVLIDSDPSNSATDYFLRSSSAEEIAKRDLYLALTGKRRLADCIMATGTIEMIPATPILARAGVELAQDPGIVLRFPKAVRTLEAEIVIIDTPPSLSLELTLALYAADIVVVPIGLSRWTVSAFSVVAGMLETVREARGSTPELVALPSIVTAREAETLSKLPNCRTVSTPILRSLAIRNALNAGKPLKPESMAALWFDALARELAGISAEAAR